MAIANTLLYRQPFDFLCLASIAISSPAGAAIERGDVQKLTIYSIGVGAPKRLEHLPRTMRRWRDVPNNGFATIRQRRSGIGGASLRSVAMSLLCPRTST